MPLSLLALEDASSGSHELQAEQFRKKTLQQLAPHPFSALDTTVGVENEFQAAVIGPKERVDLAIIIEQSNYFQNLVKRAARGDMPLSSITDLRRFLDENEEQIWENSWVRFPRHLLSPHAETTLRHDLLADKSCPDGPSRSDCHRFLFSNEGGEWLRIPVSYLLKLALADAISNGRGWPESAGGGASQPSGAPDAGGRPELNFPLLLQIGKAADGAPDQ